MLMSALVLELIGLFCMCKIINVTYFNSFGVENILKENKTFIKNENITKNIFRIQAYDSVMCGYFCIGFIDFMLNGKNLQIFFQQMILREMII